MTAFTWRTFLRHPIWWTRKLIEFEIWHHKYVPKGLTDEEFTEWLRRKREAA